MIDKLKYLFNRFNAIRKERLLGYKLLIRIVGFSALLAFMASGLQLFIEFQWDIKEVESTLNQIETSRLASVANSIWEFDRHQTEIELEGIYRLPDIAYVELKTTLGEEFKLGDKNLTSSNIQREFPIYTKKRPELKLGTLYVVANLKTIFSHLINKGLIIFVTQSIKTFFVSLFILFLVRETVTRHLGTLAQFAHRLDTKFFNESLEFSRPKQLKPDELDDVARAFNEMRTKLHNSFEELSRINSLMKTSLREKEILVHELFHRTKNTMEVIRSMLRIQAGNTSNPEVKKLVEDTSNRILTMSLVHQKLYQSNDLSVINFKEYINELTRLMIRNYNYKNSKLVLKTEISEVQLLIDTAIPCGLILNELLSNSIKHAFKDNREGEIIITLSSHKPDWLKLTFADNGIGLPKDFNYKELNTLGLRIIFAIGEQQLQGKVSLESKNGVSFTVEFPTTLYTPRV